jgi:hypothetical protein
VSDTSLPVDVDIVWTGVGDAWTTKDRHHDEWGDTKYRWRSSGTGRTAEATGSISLAALPMPQPLSGSGWLVAQTNSSTTIEIGGKRPRAARVEYFHASPHMIFPGGTAVLWWWASGSEPVTLHIDGGVGDVSDTSYATVAPSETTTYTLTATNRWGSSSAEVTVHVIPPPDADVYEPNDTVGSATAVTLDFRADLTLLPGDVDWFTFTLDEATTVRIVLDPSYPMTYPLVALLDGALQIIADGLSWSEFGLDAGTYAVAVNEYPDFDYLGLHAETGSYSLDIAVVPPPVPDEHEPNDTPAQATAITLPFSSTELTITPGDVDWFTFTLASTATVTVDIDAAMLGSTLDSYIGIFDAGLNLLSFSDDHDYFDSWLEASLTAGAYYVAVTGFPDSGFTGDHDRNGFYYLSVTATPQTPHLDSRAATRTPLSAQEADDAHHDHDGSAQPAHALPLDRAAAASRGPARRRTDERARHRGGTRRRAGRHGGRAHAPGTPDAERHRRHGQPQ